MAVATTAKKGVVLVGHGGIPRDFPRDLVMKLKRLEGQRRETGTFPTAEEIELDRLIRQWPRTPDNDPYKAGIEALAKQLRPLLSGALFALAYNEYCAPSLQEAIEALIKKGVQEITVVSSMATPGGSHSEVEIPETIEELRRQHSGVTIRYAWPFDLGELAKTLADHIRKFS